jgi:hypothetical protein
MDKNDSPFPIVNADGRLECQEIWGGICNRDSEVSAGKVIGSIYSTPCCDGSEGGDILAIADVTGHGEAVSEISRYVYDTLKTHI